MKHRIWIENRQQNVRLFRGYVSFLRGVIGETLAFEAFPYKAEISVSMVSPEEIRELNASYRQKNASTDVLSFPMTEDFELLSEGDLSGDAVLLGDVIVCPQVIENQAKDFGTTFREELSLMVIHSVLHLLGYDHMEENEKKEMFAKQEAVLSLCREKWNQQEKKQ